MSTQLVVSHLFKDFKTATIPFHAVSDVSFTIDAGQILALLGPNGAGKTTIVSMIGGYLAPTRGHISVDGVPLHQRHQRRPLIGIVFGGDLGFYGRASAQANLRFFADLARIPYRQQRAEVARVLNLVNLQQVARKPVMTFSKGMRQRLHIARALLGSPRLLLLDEPTDGLDVEIATTIRATIRQLANSGIAILLTSHTMTEVESLADQVVLLGGGTVHYHGTVANLIAQSPVTHIDRPATLEESYLALAPQLRRH